MTTSSRGVFHVEYVRRLCCRYMTVMSEEPKWGQRSLSRFPKKERVESDEVRVSVDWDYLGCVDHIKNYGVFFKWDRKSLENLMRGIIWSGLSFSGLFWLMRRANCVRDKNKGIETSNYCNTPGKIIFFSSSSEHHSLLLLLNSTKFYTSYFLWYLQPLNIGVSNKYQDFNYKIWKLI